MLVALKTKFQTPTRVAVLRFEAKRKEHAQHLVNLYVNFGSDKI